MCPACVYTYNTISTYLKWLASRLYVYLAEKKTAVPLFKNLVRDSMLMVNQRVINTEIWKSGEPMLTGYYYGITIFVNHYYH